MVASDKKDQQKDDTDKTVSEAAGKPVHSHPAAAKQAAKASGEGDATAPKKIKKTVKKVKKKKVKKVKKDNAPPAGTEEDASEAPSLEPEDTAKAEKTAESAAEGQDEDFQPLCKACHAEIGEYELGMKNGFELLACTQCGSVTVEPFPTAEQLEEFYAEYNPQVDYAARKDKNIEQAKKRIERLVRLTKGKRFLDVGCKYGFSVYVAKTFKLQPMGIDRDEKAIETAKKLFGDEFFEKISVTDYAEQGHQADIVYSSDDIETVADPDAFMEAVSRILAPGGVLYLTTPDGNHFMIPQDFTRWDAVMPPLNLVYFSKQGIQTLLERHGFTVKKFFFNLSPGIRLIATRNKTAKKT